MPRREQRASNGLLRDVVADVGVLEVRLPVDVDGVVEVAGGVEQDVLVRLDHADALGVGEVLGDPVGGDEDLGVGVVGHGGGGAGAEGTRRCRGRRPPEDRAALLAILLARLAGAGR